MKLGCNVFVSNRLLPALAVSGKQRHVKSTLALCKHPSSKQYCIILFTSQNKTGTKYPIKDNITKILTRFVNDGKATVQFKMPPHDLYIQSDVIQLKGFLHLLGRVLRDEISPKELTCSSMSVTPIATKDLAPKKLVIRSRSEYPARGFPRTLEVLSINSIKRCSLDNGILHLTKLKVLDLSDNWIEFIPEALKNLNLSELNLGLNKLHEAKASQWAWMGGNLAKTLVALNLESNKLKFVSSNIVKLHGLVTLNVNNNELTELPKCIGGMRNLRTLIASNNCLKVLPGSIKQCRLQLINLFNNHFASTFENPPQNTSQRTLPVLSLKESAARRVVELRLVYSPETIPHTLVGYLDEAKYCVCGKACFEVFIRAPEILSIASISQEFVTSNRNAILLDCYFCSMFCFRTSHFNRTRNPVI